MRRRSELERLVEDARHGGEEGAPLLRLQRRERRVGRELRAVQDVVRVPPADPGDRALVAQDRVDAPAVLPLAAPGARTRASRARGRASRAAPRRPRPAPTSRPCARARTPSPAPTDAPRTGTARPSPVASSTSAGPRRRRARPATDARGPGARRAPRPGTCRGGRRVRACRPTSSAARGVTVLSEENCSRSAAANAEPPTASVSRSASAWTSGSSGTIRPRRPRAPRSRSTPRHVGDGAAHDLRALLDAIAMRPVRQDAGADREPVLRRPCSRAPRAWTR